MNLRACTNLPPARPHTHPQRSLNSEPTSSRAGHTTRGVGHITHLRADSWRPRKTRARDIQLAQLGHNCCLLTRAHTHTNARTHARNSGLIRGWGLRRLTCQPPRLWASSSTSQDLVCLDCTNRITGAQKSVHNRCSAPTSAPVRRTTRQRDGELAHGPTSLRALRTYTRRVLRTCTRNHTIVLFI